MFSLKGQIVNSLGFVGHMAVVFNWGQFFCSQCLETSLVVTAGGGWPWASPGYRPRMLLSILQGTEWPSPQRFIQPQMSVAPQLRKAAIWSLSQRTRLCHSRAKLCSNKTLFVGADIWISYNLSRVTKSSYKTLFAKIILRWKPCRNRGQAFKVDCYPLSFESLGRQRQ